MLEFYIYLNQYNKQLQNPLQVSKKKICWSNFFFNVLPVNKYLWGERSITISVGIGKLTQKSYTNLRTNQMQVCPEFKGSCQPNLFSVTFNPQWEYIPLNASDAFLSDQLINALQHSSRPIQLEEFSFKSKTPFSPLTVFSQAYFLLFPIQSGPTVHAFSNENPQLLPTWSLFAASPLKNADSWRTPAFCSCCPFLLESIRQICASTPFWLWTSAALSTLRNPFPRGQVLLPHLWGRGLPTGGHQNHPSVFMSSDLLPYLTLLTSLPGASRALRSWSAFPGPSPHLWTTL